MATIGVIGGSGLYNIADLNVVELLAVDTPFGMPSDRIVRSRMGRHEIAFLPRHGVGHRLGPSEVPYRANIHALKQIGVTHLLSVSAVGSLTERYPPLTLVCPDQIIDRTIGRDRSYFDNGVVAHVGLAEPFCGEFSKLIVERAATAGVPVERGGTYLCIEGPQFSTKAESELYRSWGAAVIGMTAMPEARLAREAELCYAQIAMVTDFDVWHATESPVSVQAVIENLRRNTINATRALTALFDGDLNDRQSCGCADALASAIATDPAQISPWHRERLSVVAGKYLG